MTPDPAPALPINPPPKDVPHDDAWKEAMAKAIKAVAPDLADVKCTATECTGTLTGDSEADLVARAEKLQGEDSLKQLDARGVLLSAPVKKDDKPSMTIRVLFDQ